MKLQFLTFIVLFSIFALSFGESLTCPKYCDCPLKSDPVCGASKKTHINTCYAACFKDIVVSKGACPAPKCSLGYKTKTECRSIQIGKYGSKKQCCTATRNCNGNTCSYSKKKCKFSGPSIYEYPKSKCFMVKRKGKSTRTKKCCFWKRRCVGDKCNDVNKVCEIVGTFVHKKSCQYKKKGNLTYCCKLVDKTCQGPACERKCHVVTSKKVSTKCTWNKLSKGCKRRSCCYVYEKCSKGTCSTKKRCNFVGAIICQKLKKTCVYKKISPTCKQLECCKKVNKCENHKCKLIQSQCKLVGNTKCTTRHRRCKLVQRSKHVKQMKCCTSTRFCNGKQCKTYNNYCRWTKFRITNKIRKGCTWKQVGENSKRKQCCKVSKVCSKGKCVKKYSACAFKGPVLSEKENLNCKWNPYGKYGTRQRCCSFIQRCYGKKCQNLNVKCKYTGEIIVKKPMYGCKYKKYQNKFKRQRCCKWTKYCYGNTCKTIKKTCQWKGAKVKRSRKCSCKWAKHKGGEQQRCCCIFRKCKGNKCTTLRRKCKWVGKLIKTRTIKRGCHWKVYGKNIKRKRCCHKTVKCETLKGKKKCTKVIHSCKWSGPQVKNTEFIRCRKSIAKSSTHGTTTVKKCCRYLKHCYGKFCKTTNFPCYRVGKSLSVRKFKRCSMHKFQNGHKKRCCHYVQKCKGKSDCSIKKTGSCKFVGELIVVKRKCLCKWSSVSRNAFQKKCCCTSRKCEGIKCKTSAEKCHRVGRVISRKWVGGCREKKYGKNSTRKRCCHSKKQCNGKKCKTLKKLCRWVGKVSKETARVKCQWNKLDRFTKQKQCCVLLRSCVGKFCQTTKTKCKTLKKVTIRRKKACIIKKTSNGCRRTRCCSWIKKTVGNKSSILHKRCFWRGSATCVKRKCSCKWAKKFNPLSKRSCKQKRCICPKVVCYAGKCVKHNPITKWIGQQVCRGTHKKCRYVTVGVNGKQKRCCKKVKICRHKKCKVSAPKCRNVGPIHTSISEFKCRKVSVGRSKVQKQCCLITKRCVGRKCKKSKSNCKKQGPILPKGCQWKSEKVCTGLRSSRHPGHSCKLSGDPHVETFTKKQFNSYVPGDFVDIEKNNFYVHSRTKKWASSAVVVKIAVKSGNTIVETINSNQFLVNKQLVQLKKKTYETADLLIERLSKNRVLIKAVNGDFVDVRFFNAKYVKDPKRKWHQTQFLNAIINVKSYQHASGLCMHQTKRATGLFHVNYVPTDASPAASKTFTPQQKLHAEKVCKARGVKNDQVQNCAHDFLNTHDVQFIVAAQKIDQDATQKK